MAEYIEREAAYKVLTDYYHHSTEFQHGALLEALYRVPAADVQPVRHGRWIPDYDYAEYDYDGSTLLAEPRKFQDGWQGSLCGQYEPSETSYCPNCGAKMDGGET